MTAPVTLTGLDAVPLANASERTAPRRHVTVERSLLVGLLDAWQAFTEAEDSGAWPNRDVALDDLTAAMDDLGEAIA